MVMVPAVCAVKVTNWHATKLRVMIRAARPCGPYEKRGRTFGRPPPLYSLARHPLLRFASDPVSFGPMKPDFEFERAAMAKGAVRIAGVDEVGRGPLAGPVTAAAVILNPLDLPQGMNDSKKLTKRARERLNEIIWNSAEVSIGHASVEEIDEINILRASHLAMMRAIGGLETPPDYVLVDGNMLPRDLELPAQTIVKGDARCLSISAASIVAKICRDCVMLSLAQQHPGYGWETNAGYGSKSHILALQNLGVTPHHRRSFKPVHKMLYQEK